MDLFFLQLQASQFWTIFLQLQGWVSVLRRFSGHCIFSQIQPSLAENGFQPNPAIFSQNSANMPFFGWKWLNLAEELILWISGNQVCSDEGLSFPRSLEFQPFSAKIQPFSDIFGQKHGFFLAGNGWAWLNFGWKWLNFGWKRLNLGWIWLKASEMQENGERRDLDHYRIDCQRFWELQCEKFKMK